MGHQIVMQPNELFAIWSTHVDDFIVVDCTQEEIIEEFVEMQRREIERMVPMKIADLKAGKPAYYQFTKTFNECVSIIIELHGEDAESLQLLGLSE